MHSIFTKILVPSCQPVTILLPFLPLTTVAFSFLFCPSFFSLLQSSWMLLCLLSYSHSPLLNNSEFLTILLAFKLDLCLCSQVVIIDVIIWQCSIHHTFNSVTAPYHLWWMTSAFQQARPNGTYKLNWTKKLVTAWQFTNWWRSTVSNSVTDMLFCKIWY